MESQAGSNGNILQDWLNESQEIHVTVSRWDYKVSGARTPLVDFNWSGETRTKSKQKISVIGEFVIMDKLQLDDWIGHPSQDGQVQLIEGKNDNAEAFLSVNLRVDEKCGNEIWKAFTLGLCGRDKGNVTITVKLDTPTAAEWEKIRESNPYPKERDCFAKVRHFYVHSGAECELS